MCGGMCGDVMCVVVWCGGMCGDVVYVVCVV